MSGSQTAFDQVSVVVGVQYIPRALKASLGPSDSVLTFDQSFSREHSTRSQGRSGSLGQHLTSLCGSTGHALSKESSLSGSLGQRLTSLSSECMPRALKASCYLSTADSVLHCAGKLAHCVAGQCDAETVRRMTRTVQVFIMISSESSSGSVPQRQIPATVTVTLRVVEVLLTVIMMVT